MKNTDTARWPLTRDGFIPVYMVSGPRIAPFTTVLRERNQLKLEALLRGAIHPRLAPADAAAIRAGQPGPLDLPWRLEGGRGQAFLKLSDFYSTLQHVSFDAAAVLLSDIEQTVEVTLWSYMAVTLFCHGEAAGSLPRPVYKPIRSSRFPLRLRPGENLLYLCCDTLGVRDTRSVVGVQLEESARSTVSVTLPDAACADEMKFSLDFLLGATLAGDRLIFPAPAPAGCRWAVHHHDPDYAHRVNPVSWHDVSGRTEAPLTDAPYIQLELPGAVHPLRRFFERPAFIRPNLSSAGLTRSDNLHRIYRQIADVESLDRGEFGFPIANILARKYLGDTSRDDDALLAETLRLIEARVDCADFLTCGLIRYVREYGLPERLRPRAREVLTHFRYWMDQEGVDGMCFWSENHTLMFYSSAMLWGQEYPDDFFPRAGRTGRQLSEWGLNRVLAWLEDVEAWGFEEFLSGVYSSVTFAALLNLVDYGGPEISARASAVTDAMLRMLAAHTFHGGLIAPQGRNYSGVKYPFQAGALSLLNAIDPKQPGNYGEGWLAFYATSRYRPPEDLADMMADSISRRYATGNAEVVLEKHADWCLTSVSIPGSTRKQRWPNIAHDSRADPATHLFVKSYNECFHGTSCFQPGGYGYQQHLWYAALDGAAVLFANHPGSDSEGGDMRPGYWFGNGVFPMLRQERNMLGMIWDIPESHPFQWIHLYCPECRFDQVVAEDHWVFLRKGAGYIAFWSSERMERRDAVERRVYGSRLAGLCLCAGEEIPDLVRFMAWAKAKRPTFDRRQRTLTADHLEMAYQPGTDDTQYLD